MTARDRADLSIRREGRLVFKRKSRLVSKMGWQTCQQEREKIEQTCLQ